MSNTIVKYLPEKKHVPVILKTAGIIVSGIITIVVVKKLVKGLELIKENKLFQTSTGTGTETIDLGGTAGEIYDAFYNNDWFGWTEDEERAITLLNKVPDEDITKLAQVYFKLYSKILKADYIKYLTEEEYARVKDKFI